MRFYHGKLFQLIFIHLGRVQWKVDGSTDDNSWFLEEDMQFQQHMMSLSTSHTTKSPVAAATDSPTKSPTAPLTETPTEGPITVSTEDPTSAPIVSQTDSPTESPTFVPTASEASVTESPTSSNISCRDRSESLTLPTGDSVSCDLILTQNDRDIYCDLVITVLGIASKPVKQYCPESCQFDCSTTSVVSQTDPPSESETESPTFVPTASQTSEPTKPTSSGVTTESPTFVPTGSEVLTESPTFVPTESEVLTEPPTGTSVTESPTTPTATSSCRDISDSVTLPTGDTVSCDSIKTQDDIDLFCDIVVTALGIASDPIKKYCPESCQFDCSSTPSESATTVTESPTYVPTAATESPTYVPTSSAELAELPTYFPTYVPTYVPTPSAT